MAKAILCPILYDVCGSLGSITFRRVHGRVILSQKPAGPRREPTPRQLAQRRRFRDAIHYAKMALDDPETRAFYEAVARPKRRPAYHIAVADFHSPPVVEEVDLSEYRGATGDRVVVLAKDNVAVVSVRVAVASTDGTVIDHGQAAPMSPDGSRWVYVATTHVPGGTVQVTATAVDRAGGKGEAAAEKVLEAYRR